jgi:hypothetical protein
MTMYSYKLHSTQNPNIQTNLYYSQILKIIYIILQRERICFHTINHVEDNFN